MQSKTFPEGAKQTVLVNKYERNPEARAKCIEFHKARCQVCEMSFAETDLIPVCPNCHAMLHRQENGIPMTVERLKLLFEVSKNSKM